MKLISTVRYRHLIFAGMLFGALAFGPKSYLFSDTPAPAGAAIEKDKDSGKTIVTTPSGLKYADLVVGKGPTVKTGDHLVVNYEGKLTDGKKFDSSYDRGQPFDLVLGVSQVIQGWTEGLSGMKVGGKRKLIIPPELGYGMSGMGDVIPPNATLIFTVEVMSIQPN